MLRDWLNSSRALHIGSHQFEKWAALAPLADVAGSVGRSPKGLIRFPTGSDIGPGETLAISTVRGHQSAAVKGPNEERMKFCNRKWLP